MIHEAYMPVYMGSRFLARTGRDGTGRTEVVQEALADLKNNCRNMIMSWWAHYYLLSTHLAALDRRNKSFDRRGF